MALRRSHASKFRFYNSILQYQASPFASDVVSYTLASYSVFLPSPMMPPIVSISNILSSLSPIVSAIPSPICILSPVPSPIPLRTVSNTTYCCLHYQYVLSPKLRAVSSTTVRISYTTYCLSLPARAVSNNTAYDEIRARLLMLSPICLKCYRLYSSSSVLCIDTTIVHSPICFQYRP